MKKFYRLLVFLLLVSVSILIFGGKAHAQATTVVTEETGSPSSPRAICQGGVPVDFATTIQNVQLNPTTGVISYRINMGWATCGNGSNVTRAYAIYSNDPDVCPVSGWYGLSGTATDCLKYIGDPPYSGAGNGLTCFGGTRTDAQCVTTAGGSVIRPNQEPPNQNFGGSLDFIDMTVGITSWPSVKTSPGSREITGQFCQFYKFGSGFTTVNSGSTSRCINMRVRVAWNIQNAPDNGTCDAVMRGGSTIAPGETRIVDYTVRNTGGSNWGLDHPTERHRLRNRSAAIWGVPTDNEIDGSGVQNSGFGRILPPGGATSWGRNLTVPPGTSDGTYTFNWQIYGKGIDAPSPQYIGSTCPLIVTVANPTDKPYFRVYGGDVIAGRQFSDSNGACTVPKNANAKIRAYSEASGGNRLGAGGQFAVSATNSIERFMSNNMRSNDPLNLSFGNYGNAAPLSINSAGNDVAGYTGCIGNLYEITRNGALWNSASFSSLGTTESGKTFTNSTAKNDMQFITDTGLNDLAINGNIIYDNPSWSSFNEVKIPVYIVNGDINIRHDVTRLDGLYFATGSVNTCAGTVSQCLNSKLTINGAVIANKIELRRLIGDVDAAGANEGPGSTQTAEVINFTPEVYLALSSIVPSSNITSNGNYDSVVGLPPVL